MNFDNISIEDLNKVAVEADELSSNITQAIIRNDAAGELEVKNIVAQEFPLVDWLLRSAYTQKIRGIMKDPRKSNNLVQKENGLWKIKMVPDYIWTKPNESVADECCWVPFDYDTCSNDKKTLKLLCLKDCESIEDAIMNEIVVNPYVKYLSENGMSNKEVILRNNLLSMVFLTANNIINGIGVSEAIGRIVKPFNGMIAEMENPAVFTADAGRSNFFGAFKSIRCRLRMVRRGSEDWKIWVHPITKAAMLIYTAPGQLGSLPEGWTRDGDRLFCDNVEVVTDYRIPIDLEEAKGEAWILCGNNVGLFMATSLAPSEKFRKYLNAEKTLEQGCFGECTHFYNLGTVISNNSAKMMKVINIPLDETCVDAISDFSGIIVPQSPYPDYTTGE